MLRLQSTLGLLFFIVDDRFNWLLQIASLSEPVKLAATPGEEKVPAPFNIQMIHLSCVFYMRRFEKRNVNMKSTM